MVSICPHCKKDHTIIQINNLKWICSFCYKSIERSDFNNHFVFAGSDGEYFISKLPKNPCKDRYLCRDGNLYSYNECGFSNKEEAFEALEIYYKLKEFLKEEDFEI